MYISNRTATNKKYMVKLQKFNKRTGPSKTIQGGIFNQNKYSHRSTYTFIWIVIVLVPQDKSYFYCPDPLDSFLFPILRTSIFYTASSPRTNKRPRGLDALRTKLLHQHNFHNFGRDHKMPHMKFEVNRPRNFRGDSV